MGDNAGRFWENVKKEVKRQNTTQEWVAKKAGINFNTFQGWIAKGIFPRVNEAARIAAALRVSVEFLTAGTVRDSGEGIARISQELAGIYAHLEAITKAVREL